MGVPLLTYLENTSHMEHMYRVAQLVYQPYPDIPKALGWLVALEARVTTGYQHIGKIRELEARLEEQRSATGMTDSEKALLNLFKTMQERK